MTDTVDVYWSFRSPYSYLVTPDLASMSVAAEQPCIHRPSALGIEAELDATIAGGLISMEWRGRNPEPNNRIDSRGRRDRS